MTKEKEIARPKNLIQFPQNWPNHEMLIEEYRSAWESDRHLTSLNWQIASIVFAGIAAGIGLNGGRLGAGSLSISLLGIAMVVSWFLFVRRNRDISHRLLIEGRRLENGQGPLTRLENEKKDLARPYGFATVCGLVWAVLTILGGLAVFSLPSLVSELITLELAWSLGVGVYLYMSFKQSEQ